MFSLDVDQSQYCSLWSFCVICLFAIFLADLTPFSVLIQPLLTVLIVSAVTVQLSRKGKSMAFAIHMFVLISIYPVLGTNWRSYLTGFLQVRAANSCVVSAAAVIFRLCKVNPISWLLCIYTARWMMHTLLS